MTGSSPIDQYIGKSFVAEEWGRISFLNAMKDGTENQFQQVSNKKVKITQK